MAVCSSSRLCGRGPRVAVGHDAAVPAALPVRVRSVRTSAHRCRRPVTTRASKHNGKGKRDISGAKISAEIDNTPITVHSVPMLGDYLDDLPSYPSPLLENHDTSWFIDTDSGVLRDITVKLSSVAQACSLASRQDEDPAGCSVFVKGEAGNVNRGIEVFTKGGPRETQVFQANEVRAAIATCGGLCPGINTVIREIVVSLQRQYGVGDGHIFGVIGGYRGFYASNYIELNSKVVDQIHKQGGSFLGTSRGGHDTIKIVDAIEDRHLNMVFIIGGNGTHRGIIKIYEEVRKRKLKCVVVGIPKTIDNDIPTIDRSFGFSSAVQEAQRSISAAHVEATCAPHGVGLVKLMGRDSGFIAMHATLASRDVTCCLIPEVDFYLEGEGGLLEFVKSKLNNDGHAVIVIAEGAGQKYIRDPDESKWERDQSGNPKFLNVGEWLGRELKTHIPESNIKFLDPTYMIRAIPAHASDNVLCTILAHSTVHGAFAGFTGFTTGQVNGRSCFIPLHMCIGQEQIDVPTDRMWARVVSSTGQPTFEQQPASNDQKEPEKQAVHSATPNGAGKSVTKPHDSEATTAAPK